MLETNIDDKFDVISGCRIVVTLAIILLGGIW